MDMRVGMCTDMRMHTHIGMHAHVSSDRTVTVRHSSSAVAVQCSARFVNELKSHSTVTVQSLNGQ